MAEYYAVERSPEYLMHFGIRGMKWGIRKQKPIGNGRPHSAAYNKAQQKLNRVASVGGAVGGIAGGLTKGFVGGAVGGAAGALAGGLGYYATHRKQFKGSPSSSRNKKSNARIVGSKNVSIKEKEALKSFKKSTNRGAIAGALTVGGGLGGGAVGALRYARQNPNEYKKVKKAFKKMSFKDRMKYMYGR